MNAERRITSLDGTSAVAVDSRGNPINPSDMPAIDAYLDSVGMPKEFRSRAKMELLGHRTDIPTIAAAEQRSDDPTDENSPNFDEDAWMEEAIRRSAKVAEEICKSS